ncbi:MAG: YybH family protein [Gammaproteobacteria bacterium]
MKFTTPQEAEEMFYDALERSDPEALMKVWADDENVVCIHPGGPRLEGVAEVRESWHQICSAKTDWKFTISHQRYTQDTLLAIHLVRENIEVGGVLHGVMLATNIYQFMDDSWRMVLHHASADADAEEEDMEAGATLH